jgi:hypothetical protein
VKRVSEPALLVELAAAPSLVHEFNITQIPKKMRAIEAGSRSFIIKNFAAALRFITGGINRIFNPSYNYTVGSGTSIIALLAWLN